MALENIPMTVGAVGFSNPTRWLYSTYGKFLNVYGIHSGINITFNLASVSDIECKLKSLYALRDRDMCSPDDVSELEERLRTLCNLEISSQKPQTLAGISESSDKGKVVTVYRDGKPVKVVKRGKCKVSSESQRNAAENARKYAHTDEANKKRRKSINARGDGKILGEV
jgi:hypothetical protein